MHASTRFTPHTHLRTVRYTHPLHTDPRCNARHAHRFERARRGTIRARCTSATDDDESAPPVRTRNHETDSAFGSSSSRRDLYCCILATVTFGLERNPHPAACLVRADVTVRWRHFLLI
jgi:hypothetical protein